MHFEHKIGRKSSSEGKGSKPDSDWKLVFVLFYLASVLEDRDPEVTLRLL